MRNLIIVVLVAALAVGGYFALKGSAEPAAVSGTESTTAEPVSTATAEETAEAAAEKAGQMADTASDSANKVVEAVEESSGEVSEAAEQAEHDLRLADTKLIEAKAAATEAAETATAVAAAPVAKPKKPDSKFKKGTHFQEIVPSQPKVTGTNKIEVVEVFWYGCGHCFAFDPYVQKWEAAAPADVSFVRMPAIWNGTLETHARAFYTAEILAKSGALKNPGGFHDAFFAEIHKNRQPLASPRSIKAFFARFGVSSSDYDQAYKSFELDQKVRNAKDLTRRYRVSGVPAIVVNGKYSNISESLKSYEDYIGLMDTLAELER